CLIGALEHKLFAGTSHDPVLYLTKFELEYLLKMIFFETAEHDNLIDPIHEFGRELSLSGFRSGAIDLLVDVVLQHAFTTRRGKSDGSRNKFTHFLCTQIGREENHTSREIHLTIVSKRQGSLV